MDDDDEGTFLHGMNTFLQREGQKAADALRREFVFNDDCVYGAIHAGDGQIELIDNLADVRLP